MQWKGLYVIRAQNKDSRSRLIRENQEIMGRKFSSQFVLAAALTSLVAVLWFSASFLWGIGLGAKDAARFCILLTLSALIFSGRKMWRKPDRWLAATCFVILFTFPLYLILRIFGQVDILSVLFHINFGVEGVDFGIFAKDIRETAIAAAFVLFAAYAITNILLLRKSVYLLVIGAMLLGTPLTQQGIASIARMQNPIALTDYLEDPVIVPQTVRPDIIMIYLEGIERGFADVDIYGDLFAPLEKYEKIGISFTGVTQVAGTGWSLAGLVATMCGVPTVPVGLAAKNNFTEQVDFMPDMTCFGDVLARAGYQNKFVKGDRKEFAGIGNFLAAHGFSEIIDRSVIETLVSSDEIAAADADGWVLDDELTFDVAFDVYSKAITDPKPLLLAVTSFGPHGGSAIVSRGCSETGQAVLAPDLARSVACTLSDMERFLERVQQIRNDRPTMLVLLSDHLNHSNVMNSSQDIAERHNTFILNAWDYAPLVEVDAIDQSKRASMLDVYPTLLAYAGLAPADATAGLGRSLFGPGKNLVERYGLDALNVNIFPNRELSAAIWNPIGE